MTYGTAIYQVQRAAANSGWNKLEGSRKFSLKDDIWGTTNIFEQIKRFKLGVSLGLN